MSLPGKHFNLNRTLLATSAIWAVSVIVAPFTMSAGGPEGHSVTHPSFTTDEVRFFTEKVQPLLEEHCVRCHGGRNSRGELKIKSEFQVISRLGIVIGGAHGSAYNPENPSESLLLRMVSYEDEDYQMPPDGKLPDDQLEILDKWVAMGLPWDADTIDRLEHLEEEKTEAGFPPGEVTEAAKQWWSNRPLTRPDVPAVDNSEWSLNPIDAFVYSQLKEKGLSPNPEASQRTLVRRAYFNLIGLPPTPQEVEAFASDTSPDAWRNLIEELLARPEYGEKWARHWLDVVRYAESNGFERDSEKAYIWRYRDYVINSFNEDKPWDRFTLEQIAGDELDDPTKDSLIATGYHRLMQWDDEPADRLQHKYDVLDDNVRTTTEGFMAMSLGCARCHEHKADPITQEDYYRFMAFLHGVTPMSKQNVIEKVPDPDATRAVEKRKAENARQQNQIARRIERTENQARELFLAKDPSIARLLDPAPVANPVMVGVSSGQPRNWHYTTEKPSGDWFEVSFRHEEKWPQAPAPFGNGRPGGAGHNTQWTSSDIWIRTSFQLSEVPAAAEIRIFHDENAEIFLNGQKIADFNGYVTDYRSQLLSPEAMRAFQTGRNTLAIHCRQTSGGQFIDAGLYVVDRPVPIAELIAQRGTEIFPEKRVAAYRNDLLALEKLREEKFEPGIPAMIVQEYGGTPEDLHVHIRGSAHAHGEKVSPGFPEIFGYPDPEIPPVAAGAESSGRRLALAKWMTRDDNPRTSRVIVNRIWHYHFGRGICPTPSDFGVLGMKPTHPELLDWLSSEFVSQGWSIKNLHRLIMMSKTYRLSSRPDAASLEIDPVNDNFWRFNMRRLTAEEMRDSILSVIGKINLSKGGPSFFPVLPDAVLATSSTKDGKWGESPEDELYRRSVYIRIKRSLQPPELIDFDFADTDAPCPVRFTTTVPTQALNSLNSGFMNDRATDFAKRLIRDVGPGVTKEHVTHALELALGRPAQEWEVSECMDLFANLRRNGGISDIDALERFCLLVLNLNEFIYLD